MAQRTLSPLLARAVELASQLSHNEQNLLASWLFAELTDDSAFDHAIAESAHRLRPLAEQALAEYRAGLTEELDPARP
jgi:hypothetical protein